MTHFIDMKTSTIIPMPIHITNTGMRMTTRVILTESHRLVGTNTPIR